MNDQKRSGDDMVAVPSPFKKTVIEFETEEEMQEFIKYALSKEKTHSEGLERLRRSLKNHKPAKEGKK